MFGRTTKWIGAAMAAAVVTTGLAGAATAAPGAERIATVVARNCENLGVTITLSPQQQVRAQTLLPAGFRLSTDPTLLVETSRCAGAKVNGKTIGAFHLSEAALSIVAPRRAESRHLPNLVTEHIYMLSQLDTNRLLSETKASAGYRSELADISLNRGSANAVPRVMTASAGGQLAPATARAEVTPYLLPAGVAVPNPGVVYQLWTKNGDGRYVVTVNSNLRIGTPALGSGVVTVAPGTLLHTLLGTQSASGLAFSGAASGFVNDTYLFAR
ncbi:MAG: hypothetical protein WAW85_17085 [Gordonia sp. (in: high G+C Gram-positive bacteria)]|uniref:hypothetical protein n=1 Tax=Gordonia sp. (in: high G+C Gram-positive bacteria) TaxID=84139 RepID=UPI003BB80C6D